LVTKIDGYLKWACKNLNPTDSELLILTFSKIPNKKGWVFSFTYKLSRNLDVQWESRRRNDVDRSEFGGRQN